MSPSEQHEHNVAKFINESIKGLVAERPKVSTSFPDVRVEYGTFKADKAVWVEVKMNHTDNLMNPRFSYIDGVWVCPASYKSEATDLLCDIWNKNKEAQNWILGLKKFLVENKWPGNISKLTLYSSKTERVTDKNTVSVQLMKEYLKTLPNKNICKELSVDVGNLVSLHYLKGKAAKAYYLSAGDDFYQFKLPGGKNNPLKIADVPVFKGMNSIVLRVGDRSDNFEIQAEVKLKNLPASKYSVAPGNSKINPFMHIGV
jgi:hypothetical protein